MKPIDDKILEKYVQLQKNLMNEKRIKILVILNNDVKSWSQLMIELDIRNPKLLHDHLNILSSQKLIEKSPKGQYQITNNGNILLKSNIEQIQNISKILKVIK